jgi:oligopeptide transport system substrate-binding protein
MGSARMKSARLWIALSLLAILSGCGRRHTPVEEGIRTQTLHWNIAGEPRDFDPHTTTLTTDAVVIQALMEGLANIDPVTAAPVPGVAERWETSPDGLRWTFHLRPNARWSNGDAVTAADFVYACRRMLSPALGAEYREQFHCLKNAVEFAAGRLTDFAAVGVRAKDERTLELELTTPVPYLPSLVAQFCWFPVHRGTIEKFGRIDQRSTLWTRPENHVGNGAFVLKEWLPGRWVRVAKSETYWDRDRVRLNEAVLHPIENAAVGESAFRAGQLHVTNAPVDKVPGYKKDPRLAAMLVESAILQTYFFRLNCARPPFQDARVRRAFSLAIDRDKLARHVVLADTAAFSLTPPECAGYTADRSLRTDVAEAQRLLAEAGFPGGKGFPALEVPFYTEDGAEQPVLETVQQMWRANLGINVALLRQEMKTVIAARNTGDFQILAGKWLGDYLDPVTFLELMTTNGGNNRTGWSNPAYDRLLAEAATLNEPAARFARLRQAEALMLAEAPIIPLYYQPKRVLRHPAVRGWHANLLDVHPLKAVWLAP